MKLEPQRSFANRAEWRAWLAKNHASKEELWLIYYKKGSGKPSVDYAASVEEALCFGWIDGVKKRVDEKRYGHRFTPRRRSSRWSALNVARAQKLIDAGKMTAPGLAAFAERKAYDPEERAAVADMALTPELERALRANRKAWKNFTALAPSQKKYYVAWLVTAKRPETRRKRLDEALTLLAENKKLGMR